MPWCIPVVAKMVGCNRGGNIWPSLLQWMCGETRKYEVSTLHYVAVRDPYSD